MLDPDPLRLPESTQISAGKPYTSSEFSTSLVNTCISMINAHQCAIMPLMGLAPISPSQALFLEVQWLSGIGPDDASHGGMGPYHGIGMDIGHGIDIHIME